ncbi:MAG: pilus assembly protein [Acidobacteriia bacterium]|nr:pilus assembly protein [Terriglobia bacterium]
MNVIADTGFIVAFANSDDLYHEWALQVASDLSPPALTCEAVLAEAAFKLRSTNLVLELVEADLIRPAFDLIPNISQLHELANRYADRQPDLADLCVIRMSELFPRHIVITVDETDFRVYRRNKRDMIPLLCPPKRAR